MGFAVCVTVALLLVLPAVLWAGDQVPAPVKPLPYATEELLSPHAHSDTRVRRPLQRQCWRNGTSGDRRPLVVKPNPP